MPGDYVTVRTQDRGPTAIAVPLPPAPEPGGVSYTQNTLIWEESFNQGNSSFVGPDLPWERFNPWPNDFPRFYNGWSYVSPNWLPSGVVNVDDYFGQNSTFLGTFNGSMSLNPANAGSFTTTYPWRYYPVDNLIYTDTIGPYNYWGASAGAWINENLLEAGTPFDSVLGVRSVYLEEIGRSVWVGQALPTFQVIEFEIGGLPGGAYDPPPITFTTSPPFGISNLTEGYDDRIASDVYAKSTRTGGSYTVPNGWQSGAGPQPADWELNYPVGQIQLILGMHKTSWASDVFTGYDIVPGASLGGMPIRFTSAGISLGVLRVTGLFDPNFHVPVPLGTGDVIRIEMGYPVRSAQFVPQILVYVNDALVLTMDRLGRPDSSGFFDPTPILLYATGKRYNFGWFNERGECGQGAFGFRMHVFPGTDPSLVSIRWMRTSMTYQTDEASEGSTPLVIPRGSAQETVTDVRTTPVDIKTVRF